MNIQTIVLTGATGFLGQTLIPFLLETYKPTSIRLLGRSEWKLAQILRKYNDLYTMKLLRPLIVDVRDRERVYSVIDGADLVIHAAALKRLEICNFNPQEAIKTNIIGSLNVMDACLNVPNKPQKAIFISTDKAMHPTNLYGKTKAVVESMVVERATALGMSLPTMCCVRYGNVIASTGAVIPYFVDRAQKNLPLPITNDKMTRFMMTRKAMTVVIKEAIEEGKQGEIILPRNIKSINIRNAAEIIRDYFGSKSEIVDIGEFSGEKLHEELDFGITSEPVNISRQEFLEMLKEEELI